jgi:hypothetical protein
MTTVDKHRHLLSDRAGPSVVFEVLPLLRLARRTFPLSPIYRVGLSDVATRARRLVRPSLGEVGILQRLAGQPLPHCAEALPAGVGSTLSIGAA